MLRGYGWLPRNPHRWQGNARVSGGASLPDPIFRVLTDNTIVPTIGTAGTFSRASSITYPTSLTTWATVTTGNPPIGARAPYNTYHTNSVLGGVALYAPIKNHIPDSSDLITPGDWTAVGSGGGFDGSGVGADPEGGTGYEIVSGPSSGEGIEAATAVPAASNTGSFGVVLKTITGTCDATIRIVDSDTPATVIATGNVALTTTAKQYVITGRGGAGAVGNMVVQILSNQASGVFLAWQPQLQMPEYEGTGTTGDIHFGFDLLPIIKTTGSVAQLAQSTLYYAGTEFSGSAFSGITVSMWVYMPNFNASHSWADKWLFAVEDSSFVRLAGARTQSTDSMLHVYYGSNTDVSLAAGLAKSQWNHICVAAGSAGDNQTVLNGTSISETSTSWTARAAARLNVGSQYNSGSTMDQDMVNSIIGQTEVYNQRLTLEQCQSLYTTQKDNWYDDPPD